MSIKQFRRQAATCWEMAATMSDPGDKERLLKTAQAFRRLADNEEAARASLSDQHPQLPPMMIPEF
jgi:hypothetical protein